MVKLEAATRLKLTAAKQMSKGNQKLMADRLKRWGSRYGYTFSTDGGYPSIDNRTVEVQAHPNDDGVRVDIYVLPSMHIDPEGQEELGMFTVSLEGMSGMDRTGKPSELNPGISKILKENKALLDHLKDES